MRLKNKDEYDKSSTVASKSANFDLEARFNTIHKTIDDYQRAIHKHNTYRSYSRYKQFYIIDDRQELMNLYEMAITQDAHMRSVIETLESQILGDRYGLGTIDDEGEFKTDLQETKKIQGTFFEKIVRGIMEAKLYGYSLIEILPDIDDVSGKLANVSLIERRNVLPNQRKVLEIAGHPESATYDIDGDWYKDRYVLVDSGDLGLFSVTTPLVLAKKFTFGSYVNFTHTFGLPILHGKTDSIDDYNMQKFADNLAKSINDRIVVTPTGDTLDVKSLSTSNSERVFMGLIDSINKDISNAILGSESMGGASGAYSGQQKAHQDVFRDRVMVYRRFIENVVNDDVLPLLVRMGYIKDGCTFQYSRRLEMSMQEKLKFLATVLPMYDVDPNLFLTEFGITVDRREFEDGAISGIKSIDNGDGIPRESMSTEEWQKRYGGKSRGKKNKDDKPQKQNDDDTTNAKKITNYLSATKQSEL